MCVCGGGDLPASRSSGRRSTSFWASSQESKSPNWVRKGTRMRCASLSRSTLPASTTVPLATCVIWGAPATSPPK